VEYYLEAKPENGFIWKPYNHSWADIMIYFLGGPPRVGKSIIANQIRKKLSISVVSTDSIGAMLEKILRPEKAPDLFVFRKYNELPIEERMNSVVKDPAKPVVSQR
jgi:2-phosphoglycerate kinase